MNFLSKTKTAFLCCAVLIGGIAFTSCDSDQLSKRLAKNAFEESSLMRNSYVCSLRTGYFEVTGKEEIKRLKQLQAAKMITCKFEKITEQRTTRQYSWYGSSYSTRDVEHIFAQVDFTEEGKKYVVESLSGLRKDEVEDMKINDEELQKDEEVPAYMNVSDEIDEPANASAAKSNDEAATDTAAADSAYADGVMDDDGFVDSPDDAQNAAASKSAYPLAIEKINTETQYVKLCQFKLYKVKEVFCSEEMRKNGTGSCLCIIEVSDKNPFAWAFGLEYKEGERIAFKVNLKHYEDMGWVATDWEEKKY